MFQFQVSIQLCLRTHLARSRLLVIATGKHQILLDPFLDDSPTAPVKSDEVQADFILVSHGHFDHVADAAKIARPHRRDGRGQLRDLRVARPSRACKNTQPMNLGGSIALPFGRVKLTLAHHSSTLARRHGRRQPRRLPAHARQARRSTSPATRACSTT